MIWLFLHLANIFGGILLALPMIIELSKPNSNVKSSAKSAGEYGWIVGIVALVTGGYFLIVHLDTLDVTHYEVVAVIVGLLLIAPRLGRSISGQGPRLLVGIFGLIALLVGLQGLF